MHVPFLDLRVQEPLKSELLAAVAAVLDHGRILLGPEVDRFEAAVAEKVGVRHGIGVDSGSSALLLALRALGIGPGDEVVTTCLSWIATANAITMTGATPVFVDIGDDLNMDPACLPAAITERTKAIIPVHFCGKMCDMQAIRAIAEERGLPIVEDCAQAFGGHCRDGVAGSFSKIACFSMNSMKVLHSYGEAGCVATDDPALAEKLRMLRYAGTKNRSDCQVPSMNHRLDTVQAAMLLVNLGRYDDIVARRRAIAAMYCKYLDGVVGFQDAGDKTGHIYYTFCVYTDRRDGLMAFLADKGIETKLNHAPLMPYHAAYKPRNLGPFPNGERLLARSLCLPVHEKLTDEQVRYVADMVREYHG